LHVKVLVLISMPEFFRWLWIIFCHKT